MDFYFYLGLLTLGFAILALGVWLKTRSVAFVIGACFLYYWSLLGAWNIVAALRSGGETPYLFYKLFPVFLNSDYRDALLLYGLFICTVMATVLYTARPVRLQQQVPKVIEISHWKAVFLSAFCGLLGYLIIRSAVSTAGGGYGTVSNAPGYSIFQVLNHGALSITAIGLATYMSGQRARLVFGRRNRLALMGYLGLLAALLLLMMRLGNRGEVALSAVLLVLFYMANTVRPNKLLLAGTAAIGLVAIMAVKFSRDHVFARASGMGELLIRAKEELLQSTETTAAHLSMYGALHKHLSLTGGTSFLSLVASMVPHALWPNRPATIYEYYVAGVGAHEGQGYTIHHATGWYLNFGVTGVMVGALLVGWIWAKLHNLVYDGKYRNSAFYNALAMTSFWSFTSSLPDLVRSGPEVYKTTVFAQLLGPALLVVICSSGMVLRKERPVIIFRRRLQHRAFRADSGNVAISSGTMRVTRAGQ